MQSSLSKILRYLRAVLWGWWQELEADAGVDQMIKKVHENMEISQRRKPDQWLPCMASKKLSNGSDFYFSYPGHQYMASMAQYFPNPDHPRILSIKDVNTKEFT